MFKMNISFLLLAFSLQAQSNSNPVFVLEQDHTPDFKVGYATLENKRGPFGLLKAYDNQDTACVLPVKFNFMGAGSSPGYNTTLLGVFDGHGEDGDKISRVIPHIVQDFLNDASNISKLDNKKDLGKAFHKYIKTHYPEAKYSGTTACMCVKTHGVGIGGFWGDFGSGPNMCFYNVGDSRAIVVRDGKVFFATHDHKPEDPQEKERIEKAGGCVYGGRACKNRYSGGYALSRSWGDYHYDGILGRDGDGCMCLIEKNDYVVLATDGLWDALTNEEVAEFITAHQNESVQTIAEQLAQKARSGDNKQKFDSVDDITVIVAQL